AISVLISAFVALSLTPALCSMLLRPSHMEKDSKGLNKFFYKFNTWFGRVTDRYTNGVRRVIKGARLAVILLLCVFVGTFFLFKSKSTGFIPNEDEGRLIMSMELPEAASTTRSLETLDSLMNILHHTEGIQHFAALGGFNFLTG